MQTQRDLVELRLRDDGRGPRAGASSGAGPRDLRRRIGQSGEKRIFQREACQILPSNRLGAGAWTLSDIHRSENPHAFDGPLSFFAASYASALGL